MLVFPYLIEYRMACSVLLTEYFLLHVRQLYKQRSLK